MSDPSDRSGNARVTTTYRSQLVTSSTRTPNLSCKMFSPLVPYQRLEIQKKHLTHSTLLTNHSNSYTIVLIIQACFLFLLRSKKLSSRSNEAMDNTKMLNVCRYAVYKKHVYEISKHETGEKSMITHTRHFEVIFVDIGNVPKSHTLNEHAAQTKSEVIFVIVRVPS